MAFPSRGSPSSCILRQVASEFRDSGLPGSTVKPLWVLSLPLKLPPSRGLQLPPPHFREAPWSCD